MEFIISVLVTLIGGVLVIYAYDKGPRFSRWLIKTSASRIHNSEADRWEEEWLAHLTECDGKFDMVLHSLGCMYASHQMRPRTKLKTRVNARYGFYLINGYARLFGMTTGLSLNSYHKALLKVHETPSTTNILAAASKAERVKFWLRNIIVLFEAIEKAVLRLKPQDEQVSSALAILLPELKTYRDLSAELERQSRALRSRALEVGKEEVR